MSETQRQRIRDMGHERRYFSMVPHLIVDMLSDGQLTTIAFALYVYYRRHCGEFGEELMESVRATARRFGKSTGTVFAARKLLVERGLIELDLTGMLGHEDAHITIRDVWPENMEKYGPKHRNEGADARDGHAASKRKPSRLASGGPDASVQLLNADAGLRPEAIERTKAVGVQLHPDASVRPTGRPLTSSGKTLNNPEEKEHVNLPNPPARRASSEDRANSRWPTGVQPGA